MISILFHYIVLENHKTCFKETLNPWSGRLNCVERYYYCHWTKTKSSFNLTNQISFNNDTDADALKKRMNVFSYMYNISSIKHSDNRSTLLYHLSVLDFEGKLIFSCWSMIYCANLVLPWNMSCWDIQLMNCYIAWVGCFTPGPGHQINYERNW